MYSKLHTAFSDMLAINSIVHENNYFYAVGFGNKNKFKHYGDTDQKESKCHPLKQCEAL